MSSLEAIKVIREQDPNRSGSSIARELGISRERIRQLLGKLGLPTSMRKPKLLVYCLNCGKEKRREEKGGITGLCWDCFQARRHQAKK